MSFGFDPFQVFEVEHQPCMLFYIKVVQGYNITKGWAKDLLDVPDPYITVSIKTSPHGVQQTTAKDNETHPIWNETFKFYLHPNMDNILEISLMDANYIMDEHLCTRTINVTDLPIFKETVKQKVKFNEGSLTDSWSCCCQMLLQALTNCAQTSEVDIEMWAEYDNNPQLRYSLTLCDEEKEFIEKRKQKVFEAMKNILGDEAPLNASETPVIGVLGSGGGFRAMTSFCGVMSGLVETNILDMVSYNVGLSGSAWYLSTLYSHPDWPEKSPKQLREELRNNIDSSPFWLLNPSSMMRYLSTIYSKRRQGQPISFTDLFGHLVGETLLKGRLESKMTDQQEKLKEGAIPMPMYSCLHVKKHVSALVFHEWMEFSPYEIGMPKYGTFMKPDLFGSKFFIGHLVKKFGEPPLHFLQGIWGSAFCIQFKRLLKDDKKTNQLQALEQEREELERELSAEMSFQDDESSDTSDNEDEPNQSNNPENNNYKNGRKQKKAELQERRSSLISSWFGSYLANHPLLKSIDGRAASVHNFMRGLSLYKAYPFSPFTSVDDRTSQKKLTASSYFSSNLSRDSTDSSSGSIGGQEVILQQELAKPMFRHPSEATSPPADADQFDGIFEMYPTSIKKLYVVDGGLSFNSPYPLLLRPQRGVDLILSFDFSARESDTTPPFKELMLAMDWARLNNVPFPNSDPTVVEREGLKECYVFENPNDGKMKRNSNSFCELMLAMDWARLNNVPFPNIDPTVVDREGLKECYVFENPNDPRCPIVMHFVLVNITFREEKAPGVRRRTKEEKEWADFDIFDDPEKPYSTFNFKYTNKAFDRLADLTEFNTTLCRDLIIKQIKKCVQRVQQYSAIKRRPIKLKDIQKLRLSTKKEEQLTKFVQSFDEGDVPVV